MNITIWDMDWFYNESNIPNVDCMRLSSYHKQKGDKINFVTQITHLDLAFDRLYIFKESEELSAPARKWLDDSRTILLGKGFKFYGTKNLGAVVMACRPDYLLYGELEARNPYANANFITFFTATGQLITQRQDWHNTKHYHKKTLVTDKALWKADDEKILWCLQELKREKNIAFLEPISLKKLLSNGEIQQKFLSLHFSRGTKFKWKNDLGSEYEDAERIVDFLQQMRGRTSSDLGVIPFRAALNNHFDNVFNFELDLLRDFKIIYLFKTNKFKCLIKASNDVMSSPYHKWLKQLETWTQHSIKLSYIEFVTHFICLQSGVYWYNVLNTPIKWRTHDLDLVLNILSDDSWSEAYHYLFAQWGVDTINSSQIDYNTIRNNINYLSRIPNE